MQSHLHRTVTPFSFSFWVLDSWFKTIRRNKSILGWTSLSQWNWQNSLIYRAVLGFFFFYIYSHSLFKLWFLDHEGIKNKTDPLLYHILSVAICLATQDLIGDLKFSHVRVGSSTLYKASASFRGRVKGFPSSGAGWSSQWIVTVSILEEPCNPFSSI